MIVEVEAHTVRPGDFVVGIGRIDYVGMQMSDMLLYTDDGAMRNFYVGAKLRVIRGWQ